MVYCMASLCELLTLWKNTAIHHTLSSKDRVAFSAPSGRPNGKQYLRRDRLDFHVNPQQNRLAWDQHMVAEHGSYLKCVIWFSRRTRSLSLISSKCSFSSTVTVPIPSGLKDISGYKKHEVLLVLEQTDMRDFEFM